MSVSESPRLEFRDVTVDFGVTRALAHLSGSIAPGEVVGLLGHNGAGKSTFFNVLAGVVRATSGEFLVDGIALPSVISPSEVAALGITILHQEPALATNLTVLENLGLAQRLPRSGDRRRVAHEALAKVGAQLDLDALVSTLDLGQRQLVALARGLLGGEMRILLLDEPTAALGKHETDALHALIRRFAESGVTVIYVSHRLPDILAVCERIMVLSAGRLVADQPANTFTVKRLARALAPDLDDSEFEAAVPGAPSLAVSLGGTQLAARQGEVVGLFGMAAGEQFSLIESLFGMYGRAIFELDGKRVQISGPAQALRLGVHLVPGDRERDGLISGLSAAENVFLPWYARDPARGWWIGSRSGSAVYAKAREILNIVGPSQSEPIDQFSGGNRQKHLLARWMIASRPHILLLAQPTQGVDVGAKADIVRAIRSLAANGATVIVASAEADEIASMCDRAFVLVGPRVRELARTPDFDARLLEALLDLADQRGSSLPEGASI